MKFTKEQFLDALKTKLTANGKHLSISERTMKDLSDSHYGLLVKEETELDDLVKTILPQYVSLNGNYEKDNADFIKKWNDEHPPVDPPKPNEPPKSNESSAEIKALMDEVKSLKEKEAQRETEKLISLKRNELLTKFKEKGIKDEKWTEKYMSKLALTKDTDVEKETADALDFYNLTRSKSGFTPGKSGGEDTKAIDAKRWEGLNKVLGTNKA